MTKLPWGTASTFLFLLVALPYTGAARAQIYQLGVQGGMTTDHRASTLHLGGARRLNFDLPFRDKVVLNPSIEMLVGVLQVQREQAQAELRDIGDASLIFSLQAPMQGAVPWYLNFGIGPEYLLRDSIGAKKLGSYFHFHSYFGVGFYFNRRYFLTTHIEHTSNGGIQKPNPGFNTFSLRLGVEFEG